MTAKIHTNNVPRDVIYGYELSEKERAEFGYIDWAAVERGEQNHEFFRYKGQLYHIGDFMTTAPGPWNHGVAEQFPGWDGYASDSFFSGMLIKWPRESGEIDTEHVIVGWYCC